MRDVRGRRAACGVDLPVRRRALLRWTTLREGIDADAYADARSVAAHPHTDPRRLGAALSAQRRNRVHRPVLPRRRALSEHMSDRSLLLSTRGEPLDQRLRLRARTLLRLAGAGLRRRRVGGAVVHRRTRTRTSTRTRTRTRYSKGSST